MTPLQCDITLGLLLQHQSHSLLIVIPQAPKQSWIDRKRASSQRPYGENGTQLNLLLLGHMQSPDRGNRDDQNHEIANDVNDASADEYSVLIQALLSSCNFSGFADAFGRNGEDEGKRVEKIPVEDEPNAGVGIGISVLFPFNMWWQAFLECNRFVCYESFLLSRTCMSCGIRFAPAQDRL